MWLCGAFGESIIVCNWMGKWSGCVSDPRGLVVGGVVQERGGVMSKRVTIGGVVWSRIGGGEVCIWERGRGG